MNKDINAWMLSIDGKIIPIQWHLYGSYTKPKIKDNYFDITETISASLWLYKKTSYQETKLVIEQFIGNWILNEFDYENDLLVLKKQLHEFYFSKNEYDEILKIYKKIVNKIKQDDINKLNDEVCNLLNNEFTRVRYKATQEDKWNSYKESKELWFRISSIDFKWMAVIYNFILNFDRDISSISICKDLESTGKEDFLPYQKPVDHISRLDFLKEFKLMN